METRLFYLNPDKNGTCLKYDVSHYVTMLGRHYKIQTFQFRKTKSLVPTFYWSEKFGFLWFKNYAHSLKI